MKCPFCGLELKRIVQQGYKPANVPDRIYYDHKITGRCKHGDGHTLSYETWMERKASVK